MPAINFYFSLRKLIHILSGLLFIWCSSTCPRPRILLTVIILLILILDNARRFWHKWDKLFRKIFLPLLKDSESEGKLTGATTLWFSLYLIFILFPGTIFLPAALIIIFADPAGALVGKAIGKKSIYGEKTREGSLAFILISVVILWQYRNIPLIPAVFISIILGITEAVAPEKYENLFIAIEAALLLFIYSLI